MLANTGRIARRSLSCLHHVQRHCHFGSTIPDFAFYPDYLDVKEQLTLLTACLGKLDMEESRRMRRRREQYVQAQSERSNFSESSQSVASCFLPDELYQFEEGHFDGVIRHYREMHVSTWDAVQSTELDAVLKKLKALYPSAEYGTQTHILHLASTGEILPHVDNIEASGRFILGVSLGSTRCLRMEPAKQGGKKVNDQVHEINLTSGSVYVQSDSTRYNYAHSILHEEGSAPGQRLSLMVRDCLASSST